MTGFDSFYGDVVRRPKQVIKEVLIEKEMVDVYEVPSTVALVEMTEEVIDSLSSELESLGKEEGIDFLVDEDGKFLCTDEVDKVILASRGYVVGDLW